MLQAAEVDHAIAVASSAFGVWRERPARERARILRDVANIVRRDAARFAAIITEESGKPLKEARGEVAYAADYFDWFAAEAQRIYGDIIPSDAEHKRILALKEPIGVVLAITPWNFPLAMLARKMAAALAAGCAMIAKPALETPLTAFMLGEAVCEAGIPAGVVNIITGDAELIANRCMTNPAVRKVSFTGSTEVGKSLIQKSADTVKKLTLELGGNAPFIVCDDADLELAIQGAIHGKYRNAGQTCICVNRFLVHEAILDQFTSRPVERTKSLVVGDGADEKTDIGPLISHEAVAKVRALTLAAIADGATLLTGDPRSDERSCFMNPIVLRDVRRDMRVWREEIFGPVSAIASFSTDREAIEQANDTPHGLAAYVFSRDTTRALRLAERLECGMVGVNDTVISAVQAPFGGIKESGFGREGSKYGIDEYLTIKYVSLHL